MPRGRLPLVHHLHRAGGARRARGGGDARARRCPSPSRASMPTTCACGWSASAAPASSRSARCSAWRRCSTGATPAGSTRPGSRRRRGRWSRTVHITSAPIEDGVTPASTLDRRAARLRPARRGDAAEPARRRPRAHRRDRLRARHADRPRWSSIGRRAGARPTPARDAIDAATRAGENVYLDAQRICERLFGDATPANVLVLGAAWQRGALPVSLGALREAFRLNGVGVERNLAALEWGARLGRRSRPRAAAPPARRPPPRRSSPQERALVDAVAPGAGELRRAARGPRSRISSAGADRARAARYADDDRARARASRASGCPGSSALTEAVARGLHKLMAYKDEYEVARLHLDGPRRRCPRARATLPPAPADAARARHAAQAALGRWFVPVLRVLRAARGLRGTALDPFGAHAACGASNARCPASTWRSSTPRWRALVAGDARARRRGRGAAGAGPRLRGDQARGRRALPRAGGRAGGVASATERYCSPRWAPPSSGIAAPVRYAAWAEQRKATSSPNSATPPRRRAGIRANCWSSVSPKTS